MNQAEWRKKLQEEGFVDIKIIEMSPHHNTGEHLHEEEGVHIILKGEVQTTGSTGTNVYKAGDRLDIPSMTKHTAVFGAEGCTMLVGIKKN